MPAIQSKLPDAGTTIFTVMSSLAQKHQAINLGQGFPDFPMDPRLIGLVTEAMRNGHNQYVHMNGLPALRTGIAQKIDSLYKSKVNEESEITITPGGTYAIFSALTSILNKGDEVIFFEPAYDSYVPGILLNGGLPVPVKLLYPDFSIDWNEVRAKITPRTKAIILNSPHNPTGVVLNENDIEQLRTVVNDTDIFIISDEVYEHIIFDGKQHLSMLRYPDLYERSFVCFSFGKVYHCTGWKLGYVVAPPYLMKEFRRIHQFNCFTCNSPMQYALSQFIKEEENYLQLGSQLQQKRDQFLERMKTTKFKPLPSSGSYFQLYDYSRISDESEKDFAVRLTEQTGVATIPVSAFYLNETNHQLLRFCFVKKEETLDEATERLMKL